VLIPFLWLQLEEGEEVILVMVVVIMEAAVAAEAV
jgi:hypothetical protein